MTNIFQIDENIKDFLDSLPETGEMSEIDIADFADMQEEREKKQKNTILYYKSMEGEEDVLSAEIKRLTLLKSGLVKKKQRIIELIEYSMVSTNQTEINFIVCGAKYRKNPPKIIINSEEDIPVSFTSIQEIKKIDKKAIKAAIKAGEEVPGATMVQEQKLTIS